MAMICCMFVKLKQWSISMAKVSMVNHQESVQRRLDNLRKFLVAELSEPKPAQLYVADLRLSIHELESQLVA